MVNNTKNSKVWFDKEQANVHFLISGLIRVQLALCLLRPEWCYSIALSLTLNLTAQSCFICAQWWTNRLKIAIIPTRKSCTFEHLSTSLEKWCVTLLPYPHVPYSAVDKDWYQVVKITVSFEKWVVNENKLLDYYTLDNIFFPLSVSFAVYVI